MILIFLNRSVVFMGVTYIHETVNTVGVKADTMIAARTAVAVQTQKAT